MSERSRTCRHRSRGRSAARRRPRGTGRRRSRRAKRHARPARAASAAMLWMTGTQAVTLALPAFQAQRGIDHVVADHDHGIAREELRAFAVRRHEGAFLVLRRRSGRCTVTPSRATNSARASTWRSMRRARSASTSIRRRPVCLRQKVVGQRRSASAASLRGRPRNPRPARCRSRLRAACPIHDGRRKPAIRPGRRCPRSGRYRPPRDSRRSGPRPLRAAPCPDWTVGGRRRSVCRSTRSRAA